MDQKLEDFVLQTTGAKGIGRTELIQPLWNGYGELLRIELEGARYSSVVLKHIQYPTEQKHPKGFHSEFSHNRKVRSYGVEFNWYKNYNPNLEGDSTFRTARLLGMSHLDGVNALLLEDLICSGFSQTPKSIEWNQVQVVLKWLASFHAKFLGVSPKGLWSTGTYWHLATRPDELEALKREDSELWSMARDLDQALENCKYRTFVHGDAKLANFLFSEDFSSVAAVDFQYVGGGCGMKDVAYFIGSCMQEQEAEDREEDILDCYFEGIEKVLGSSSVVFDELEKEWRMMYLLAWADFYRFLKGWSPGHWKINSYGERLLHRVKGRFAAGSDN